MNLQNNKVNNVTSDNKNQIEQNTNNDVTNNTNNNSTQNVEQKTTEQKIADAYKKLPNAIWSSKTTLSERPSMFQAFNVENGKVICTWFSNKEVPFNFGKPKYATSLMYGGVVRYATIITEEGKAYISDDFGWSGLGKAEQIDNIKFNEININGKVIDIAVFDNQWKDIMPNSYPYYLTEDGNLYNRDGKKYEQINRKHIGFIGTIAEQLYLNNDGTMELLGLGDDTVNIYGINYDDEKYVFVKDANGNRIKAKYIFLPYTSDKWFIIDNNYRLLEFSSETNYIAKESSLANGQKIKSVDKNEENNKIKLTLKLENEQIVNFDDVKFVEYK